MKNLKKIMGLNKKALLKINVFLLIAILVLVNLVSQNAFFRLDLTQNNAYSLSQVSTETLSMLEDPLRVQVFYSSDLPAPYNGVRQYLLDLLREYDGAEKEFFSFDIVDMSTPEGKAEAQGYGLQQVEVQEVQSDEFQSRAVYMGAVVLYGNVVEPVDHISNTDGLEYRLTTAMNSAVNQIDALSGSSDITMKIIVSPSLGDLQIQGFSGLEEEMQSIFTRINNDNFGRISYDFIKPSSDTELDELVSQFGVQPLQWVKDGEKRRGILSIVLSSDENTERVPLQIFSQLFGGYSLDSPENIEDTVRKALRSLASTTVQVAYATGNGEKNLFDNQQGAGPFSTLLSERYKVVPVDLSSENIPAGIDTLIINGPEQTFSDQALYRIDQFLMSGGSLLAFLDSYRQIIPSQQEMMAGVQPHWEPVSSGIEPLFKHYGVILTDTFVLDEESYKTQPGANGEPSRQIFQAPILGGDGINNNNAVTAGLQDIIVLNARGLKPVEEGESVKGAESYFPLLQTSSRSWDVDSPEKIGPWITGVPPDAVSGSRDVAVLLSGDFTSWFSEPVNLGLPVQKNSDSPGSEADGNTPDSRSDNVALQMESYLSQSVSSGKVLVIGSSAFTTPQLLDPRNRSSNGTFLMNCVDSLNGMPGMAELRSKGLGSARLKKTTQMERLAARWGNTVAVPFFVVIIGLVIWLRRRSRARFVQSIFSSETENR